jgi:hypothetical protein
MEDTIIIFLIATLIIVIPIIRLILCYKNYKNSNYYKATSNSFLSVFWNSGRYGEYSLYRHLQPFELSNCKFLFNLYVPRENGKTSEIDLIMFHPKGLFVIESKNYNGWIFGNEKNKQWTQTLPIGYGESHKERFYNPIMQNSTHIRAIRRYIDSSIPVYSVIAFSDKCTLKDVTVNSNVIVTYYSDLQKEIQFKLSENNSYTMTPELLNETYSKLSQYANADNYTKIQHIHNNR